MATSMKDAKSYLRLPKTKTGIAHRIYDTEKEELKRKLEEKNIKIRELERQNDDLRKKMDQQIRASNKLTIEDEKAILDFKQQSGTDVNKVLSDENERLQNEIRQLKIDCTEQKAEVDRLRLSKITGNEETDEIPSAQVHVSDPYRPKKIEEMLSTLYDDKWVDAYEILHENEDERTMCDYLLDLFKACWTFCKENASSQLNHFQQALMIKEKDDLYASTHFQLVTAMRKNSAREMLPNLYKKFKSKNLGLKKELQPYLESCLEICWYSVITDPPLQFVFEASKQPEDFRSYTKTGKNVDFVVWPSMYLYKNGPILSKGVAEFKD